MDRWIVKFIQCTYYGCIVRSVYGVVEADSETHAYDRAYERIAEMLKTEAGWMLDGICPID